VSANGDVLEGIKTRWAAVSALTAIIPTASLFTGSVPAKALPYCVVTVKRDRDPEYQAPVASGSAYIDYRRVTFKVYADAVASLDAAMDVLETAFNVEFTVPNGTALFWQSVTPEGVEEEQDPDSAAGEVYSDTAAYVLMQQRTVP
jgi:hypothetical protein